MQFACSAMVAPLPRRKWSRRRLVRHPNLMVGNPYLYRSSRRRAAPATGGLRRRPGGKETSCQTRRGLAARLAMAGVVSQNTDTHRLVRAPAAHGEPAREETPA